MALACIMVAAPGVRHPSTSLCGYCGLTNLCVRLQHFVYFYLGEQVVVPASLQL